MTIYRVNLGHGFLPDARLRGIFCAGEGQVHRARMPALDQEWRYTTEVPNFRYGRKAEIGVNSQNRLIPAENRGTDNRELRPLCLQQRTFGR